MKLAASGLNQNDLPILKDDRIAVSVAEATRLSGLGRSFLYAGIAARRLPFISRGKRRLILVDRLRAYLQGE